ncbi:MAG TPA: MFS transporter, partial [Clostridia bacterium]|nr:MFS transporter [Clostridia bacterium]
LRIKKLPLWKRNLIAVWVTQFMSLLGFAFCVPVLPYYIQELGVTSPDLIKLYTGLMSAVPAISLGVMAPIWGNLADRFGKKIMMVRAMFFAFIVLFLLGLAQNVNQVLMIRLMQGLFTGTVAASYALVAAGTPDENMSYAIGILSSSIFIGNSAGLAVGGIVADLVGYRTSFLIGSAVMLAGLAFVMVFVKEIKSGETVDSGDGKIKVKSSIKALLPVASVVLSMIFMIRIARTLTDPYIPIYIQEIRNTLTGSATISGLIRAFSSIATAVAGIFIVRLGDRMDRFKLSAVLLALGALLAIPMFLIRDLVVFTIMNFLVFLAIGGVDPIMSSQASLMVKSENRGVLFGLITMVGSFGWAVSPLIGSFVTIRFSTTAIFAAFSILMAFSAGMSYVIYIARRKKSE